MEPVQRHSSLFIGLSILLVSSLGSGAAAAGTISVLTDYTAVPSASGATPLLIYSDPAPGVAATATTGRVDASLSEPDGGLQADMTADDTGYVSGRVEAQTWVGPYFGYDRYSVTSSYTYSETLTNSGSDPTAYFYDLHIAAGGVALVQSYTNRGEPPFDPGIGAYASYSAQVLLDGAVLWSSSAYIDQSGALQMSGTSLNGSYGWDTTTRQGDYYWDDYVNTIALGVLDVGVSAELTYQVFLEAGGTANDTASPYNGWRAIADYNDPSLLSSMPVSGSPVVSAVPEPPPLWLMASGLGVIGLVRLRRTRGPCPNDLVNPAT